MIGQEMPFPPRSREPVARLARAAIPRSNSSPRVLTASGPLSGTAKLGAPGKPASRQHEFPASSLLDALAVPSVYFTNYIDSASRKASTQFAGKAPDFGPALDAARHLQQAGAKM